MISRRQFFGSVALAGAGAVLAPVATKAKGVATFPTGTYLARGFNAALVNALGVDFVAGDDDIIRDVWALNFTALQQLNCEYIHRYPRAWNGVGEVASVRANLSQFRNRWMILNEPCVWGYSAESSAQNASEIITNIVATNPGIANYFILDIFSSKSTTDPTLNLDYVSELVNFLTPFARSRISAFGAHIYPQTHDPHEVKVQLKDCRQRMNLLGFTALPLILTETGFSAVSMTQLEAADYIPALAAELGAITGGWFNGVSWFSFNFGEYCNLCKANGLALTRAGNAWANL